MVWTAVLSGLMRSALLKHSLRIGEKRDFAGDCVMVRDAQSGGRLLLLDASDEDAGLAGV